MARIEMYHTIMVDILDHSLLTGLKWDSDIVVLFLHVYGIHSKYVRYMTCDYQLITGQRGRLYYSIWMFNNNQGNLKGTVHTTFICASLSPSESIIIFLHSKVF